MSQWLPKNPQLSIGANCSGTLKGIFGEGCEQRAKCTQFKKLQNLLFKTNQQKQTAVHVSQPTPSFSLVNCFQSLFLIPSFPLLALSAITRTTSSSTPPINYRLVKLSKHRRLQANHLKLRQFFTEVIFLKSAGVSIQRCEAVVLVKSRVVGRNSFQISPSGIYAAVLCLCLFAVRTGCCIISL